MPTKITARVSGAFTLKEIESSLKFEEAKSREFITSTIENDKDNLAQLNKLTVGTFPDELKLTLAAEADPNGYKAFPNNPISMIVETSAARVKAWRKI